MSSKSFLRLSFLAASCGGLVLAAVSDPDKPVLDPIASLEERVAVGKAKLAFEPGQGYLKAVLKELNIPTSSQTLVWTKTSLQGFSISPQKPRAIYFNEDSYVAWVNGGELIEIITVHPEKGPRFYSIRNEQMPAIEIQDEFNRCIACHAGRGLGGVPRLFAKSVFAGSSGRELVRESGIFMTSKTPLDKRWGGWYVTGSHGVLRHRGNSFAAASNDPDNPVFNADTGANQTDLSKYFDTSQYLAGSSDIVALMVMEHQMQVQNEISRTAIAVRAGEPVAEATEDLVQALMLADEAPIKAKIKGSSDFQAQYEKGGKKDKDGKSLRDLDLNTRLYKYRVSPMIVSASFEGLPASAKSHVLKRIVDILGGKEKTFSIPEKERKETLTVLMNTFALSFTTG